MDIIPSSTFDLRNENSFFGGWPVIEDSADKFSIVIAFPVEGWQESAAITVTQYKSSELSFDASGCKDTKKAINQALATLSLDVNDKGWSEVGNQDAVIGNLQKKYNYLRPVLFHSPYEAAAGFVIGQRISIRQRQALQSKIAEKLGEAITINGQDFFAFPLPQKLLELDTFPGLNPVKVERLKGIAKAALEGRLDRAKLLALPTKTALTYLQNLPGIGPFYASGILYRGAGIVDGITDDTLTKYVVQQAYRLPKEPTHEEVVKIAQSWKPYRMWAEVLLHIWMRREVGMPKRRK
jgi:DNA-3-methyladenine glycosylase II